MMQLRGGIFFSPCCQAKKSFIAIIAIPLSFSACICALNSAGEIARLRARFRHRALSPYSGLFKDLHQNPARFLPSAGALEDSWSHLVTAFPVRFRGGRNRRADLLPDFLSRGSCRENGNLIYLADPQPLPPNDQQRRTGEDDDIPIPPRAKDIPISFLAGRHFTGLSCWPECGLRVTHNSLKRH
jgi:hypothetical protein